MAPKKEKITPTTAAAWRAESEEVVELPSGNSARLRRPRIMAMLQRGQIPNPLMTAALSASDAGGTAPEDPRETVEFMAWLVAGCFVEPRVVVVGDDPERGHVTESEVPPDALRFDELADSDITYVASWWSGETAEMLPFRGNGAGASSGGDGGEVLLPPVGVTGD